jgi:sugar O-acyltransferase (sialic acid O-acetyltransferase NeuD family)
MKKIALVGSTELARRLIYYIQETNYGNLAGMFDDFEEKGSIKYGHPILGRLSDIPMMFRDGCFDEVLIAIGYNHMALRKKIFCSLKEMGIPVGTYIHPSAYIAASASVREGCIVLINCIVEMNAVLHENVFLGSAGFISHDVNIGAHTYCSPSLNIAGHSTVGECCFLGINTTTINEVTVGNNVIAGAGSVVTKDIPAYVLVAGVPAQIKKQLSENENMTV